MEIGGSSDVQFGFYSLFFLFTLCVLFDNAAQSIVFGGLMMRRILFVLIIALLVVMYRNRRDLNYDAHYVLNRLDEMIENVLNAYVRAKY